MTVSSAIKALVRSVGDNLPPEAKRDYYRLHRYRFEHLLDAIPADAGRRVLANMPQAGMLVGRHGLLQPLDVVVGVGDPCLVDGP